ncbi:MAG: hypothetical protein ACXVZU_02800 [Methanobacteriaceae archaeon]
MRMVIKENFGRDMVEILLKDILKHARLWNKQKRKKKERILLYYINKGSMGIIYLFVKEMYE